MVKKLPCEKSRGVFDYSIVLTGSSRLMKNEQQQKTYSAWESNLKFSFIAGYRLLYI